jgi:hypothetical protein
MRVFEKTFDPLSGITTTIGSEDDKMVVKSDADVSAALDYAKRLRETPEYTKQGIKNNLWHTVHLPDIVILKMKMEDGFDVYSSTAREIRQFLNKNRDKYGYLFVTEGMM